MARSTYDCSKCPGYCCCIYGDVNVSKFDIKRLAKHFGQSIRTFTKRHIRKSTADKKPVLKMTKDGKLSPKSCVFLDNETRRCTVYKARPNVCRRFPYQKHCGLYDLLTFQRNHEGNEDTIPLVQLEVN